MGGLQEGLPPASGESQKEMLSGLPLDVSLSQKC